MNGLWPHFSKISVLHGIPFSSNGLITPSIGWGSQTPCIKNSLLWVFLNTVNNSPLVLNCPSLGSGVSLHITSKFLQSHKHFMTGWQTQPPHSACSGANIVFTISFSFFLTGSMSKGMHLYPSFRKISHYFYISFDSHLFLLPINVKPFILSDSKHLWNVKTCINTGFSVAKQNISSIIVVK